MISKHAKDNTILTMHIIQGIFFKGQQAICKCGNVHHLMRQSEIHELSVCNHIEQMTNKHAKDNPILTFNIIRGTSFKRLANVESAPVFSTVKNIYAKCMSKCV